MELAQSAVQKALDLKATEAEAYVQRTKTVNVEFDSEVQNIKTIESVGIGLRVALGKRIAMYSTSIFDAKEIDDAIKRAVKIAKVAPEDPDWKNMNRKFGKAPAKGYYDNSLEELDYEQIVGKLNTSVKLIEDYDKRVKPTRGILLISISNTSIANGYEESLERKETSILVWIRTKMTEAGLESTGNEHQETKFWKDMKFEDLATNAASKAVAFLKAKPIPSEKTSLIIRNQIFANIFGVLLGPPINADWVQKGRSPLVGKLGTQIASENVSVVDDGVMDGGWLTRPFDDEGHPAQKTSIIDKGILRNYLYDTYTALKANAKSTGNAQRQAYWVKPQPAPTNLILKSGDAQPEEMIRETKRGIYVDTTIGEWLSNPVSGNLNATISHGYRISNGELKEPIKGVVISGNFYELLKNGMECVGKDLRNSQENYSPTVKLAEVTVAGE